MDFIERKQKFYDRFGLHDSVSEEEAKESFRVGICNILRDIDTKISEDEINRFCSWFGFETLKWKYKKAPTYLLDRIYRMGKITEEGNLVFESDSIIFNELAYLRDGIEFPPVDEEFKDNAIYQTIEICLKQNKLSEKDFIETLSNKLSHKNLKSSIKECLTSISIRNIPFKNFSVFESKIFFYKNQYPKKFISHEILIKKKFPNTIQSSYTKCIIQTTTASNEVGIHLENLNVLRALFFLENNFSWEIKLNVDRQPINRIRLGQFHTLHCIENGSSNALWYEPKFIQANLVELNAKSKRYYQKILKKINECKYKDKLKTSLLIYVKSLDEYDEDIALVLLWNAIDILTNDDSGRYHEIAKRFRGFFHNSFYHSDVIEVIKNVRNNYVHRLTSNVNSRNYCYELQRYFRNLFYFHIKFLSHLKSMQEALSAIDYLIRLSVKGGNEENIIKTATKLKFAINN